MKRATSLFIALVLALSMIATCASATEIAEFDSQNLALANYDTFDWCKTSYNRGVAALMCYIEFTQYCDAAGMDASYFEIKFPYECHIFNFWSSITVLYQCKDGSGFTIEYNPSTKMIKAEDWALSYENLRGSYDMAIEQYDMPTTEIMSVIKEFSGK